MHLARLLLQFRHGKLGNIVHYILLQYTYIYCRRIKLNLKLEAMTSQRTSFYVNVIVFNPTNELSFTECTPAQNATRVFKDVVVEKFLCFGAYDATEVFIASFIWLSNM